MSLNQVQNFPLGCLMISDKIAAKFDYTALMIGLTYNAQP